MRESGEIIKLSQKLRKVEELAVQRESTLDRSGGGGDDNEMETRLAKLEAVLPMLATKGDVAESKADIIKWLSAIIFAATAITIATLGLILNRIAPSQTSAAPQPIVIQLPAPPAPTHAEPPAAPLPKKK